jgi:hypothetical protein
MKNSTKLVLKKSIIARFNSEESNVNLQKKSFSFIITPRTGGI